MKAESAMKSKLHAFFIFSFHGGYVYSSGSKETAHISHRQYFSWGGHPSAPVTYPIATTETSTVVALATATQHSHADLNICIKPPIRSPAQTHVLYFNCFPLSYFHSQIPKTYTFQSWYSRSLCHSFLCLQSPCRHNSNDKHNHATQCLQHSP
jgi:hypothetical protein